MIRSMSCLSLSSCAPKNGLMTNKTLFFVLHVTHIKRNIMFLYPGSPSILMSSELLLTSHWYETNDTLFGFLLITHDWWTRAIAPTGSLPHRLRIAAPNNVHTLEHKIIHRVNFSIAWASVSLEHTFSLHKEVFKYLALSQDIFIFLSYPDSSSPPEFAFAIRLRPLRAPSKKSALSHTNRDDIASHATPNISFINMNYFICVLLHKLARDRLVWGLSGAADSEGTQADGFSLMVLGAMAKTKGCIGACPSTCYKWGYNFW